MLLILACSFQSEGHLFALRSVLTFQQSNIAVVFDCNYAAGVDHLCCLPTCSSAVMYPTPMPTQEKLNYITDIILLLEQRFVNVT